MPLKHSTETLLTFLLALLIVLAGVASALLPPFATSPITWGALLVVAALYPIVLTPLFRARRADNTFRLLHALPFVLLLGALKLQLLSQWRPSLQRALTWYTWGWSLIPVALALFVLLLFCLRIMRQRGVRSTALLSLFVPFAVLAVFSEEQRTPVPTPSETNLARSSDPKEEQWRIKLRSLNRRQARITARAQTGDLVVALRGAKNSVLIASDLQSGSNHSKPPPRLPSSGMGAEVMTLTMLAGYCGVVHIRAKKRSTMKST